MAHEATSHGGDYRKGDSPPVRRQEPGYAVLDDESGERFVSPAEFAGYALQDPLGCEIGKVEKLFVNGKGGAEYVAVKVGFFLRKILLIPVESVSADDERRILTLR
ncbi:MAG: hypothetical protein H0U91_02505 [Rubrobacter sp.]|jgi:hypothetical protein|nr:hypothetical protein [Rubrobacter sp.]MBA3951652.1 hypothetical protein [Rubrobacter sp.]MDQ3360748.1 hypothetical protein [Actinomycetota bacterium]MDQ3378306.1 hypothetical protein [Actinomycetota bacterium]